MQLRDRWTPCKKGEGNCKSRFHLVPLPLQWGAPLLSPRKGSFLDCAKKIPPSQQFQSYYAFRGTKHGCVKTFLISSSIIIKKCYCSPQTCTVAQYFSQPFQGCDSIGLICCPICSPICSPYGFYTGNPSGEQIGEQINPIE